MTNNIRRKVCQICNRLVKRGYIRTCAMSTAWKLIRCQSVSTRVTGTSFDGRQNVLELLAKYHPELIGVQLVREPQNPTTGTPLLWSQRSGARSGQCSGICRRRSLQLSLP